MREKRGQATMGLRKVGADVVLLLFGTTCSSSRGPHLDVVVSEGVQWCLRRGRLELTRVKNRLYTIQLKSTLFLNWIHYNLPNSFNALLQLYHRSRECRGNVCSTQEKWRQHAHHRILNVARYRALTRKLLSWMDGLAINEWQFRVSETSVS